MPAVEIIVLANSRKHSGRCVAGLRTDGQGWIRPIADSIEGTLHPRHYLLNNGSEPQLLDVIRVKVTHARPEKHHPENWIISFAFWELVSRPAPPLLWTILQSHLITGPSLLGNVLDRVPYAAFETSPTENSLALVEPEDFRWVVKTNPSGERRVRIAFTLHDAPYDLSLTDPKTEQRLLGQPDGIYPYAAAGFSARTFPLLTISLSEPFRKSLSDAPSCFKLAAAVLPVPQSWRSEESRLAAQAAAPVAAPVKSKQTPDILYVERLVAIQTAHLRAYANWSKAEDDWLTRLFHAGHSVKQIAAHLQRQEDAIRSHLQKLELSEKEK